jgi:glycosyltransferase involved in cell wall biosynthesis
MWTLLDEERRQRRLKETSVVVIIPYYNGSEFIERSAQSVLDQTIAPAEFIVVDDGSTQEESCKLDEIADRMGFRVLRKSNGGQGSARNAGVSASTSSMICFLDQDDFYLSDHIETLISEMPDRDRNFGWIYGELFEAERDGAIVRTSVVSHHSKHPKTTLYDILSADMFILPSASMISRKAFERVGGFDEQFMGYEDDDLFVRLFRAGFSNYFTPKAVTVWCIHTESTSYGIRMARSRLRYFRKLALMFPDDPMKSRFYFRDALLPRFHRQIMIEAILAASGKGGKYADHCDEYIAIARDYARVVLAQKTVSRRLKISLWIRIYILSDDRLRSIYRLRGAVFLARRIGRILSFRHR